MKINTTIRTVLIGVLTLSAVPSLFAQLDTQHYIPPIWGGTANRSPITYLNLSTPCPTPFQVTVTDGAGNFLAAPTISQGSSATVNLGNSSSAANANAFLYLDANLGVSGEGLIATGPKPFYANYRAFEGTQAIIMSAKGSCGLGTDYYAGHMVSAAKTNLSYRSHYISVMATEANTQVCFDNFAPGLNFNTTTLTGSPPRTADFCVTLQAGQSYVLGVSEGNLGDVPAPVVGPLYNSFHGTHVSSDKKVAVSSGSYLSAGENGGGQDGGGDILIPTDKLGTEYVLHQAAGTTVKYGECAVIVATQPNTQVAINGGVLNTVLPSPGDEAVYCIPDGAWTANKNMYVQSDKPVYVYQTMTGGNNYVNVGMALVPALDCLMDNFVDSMANVNLVGSANVYITAQNGDAITINGNPVLGGAALTGNPNWVTYRLSGLTGDQSVASDGPISVSFVNTSGARSGIGYYAGLPSPPIVTLSNDCPITTLGVFSNTYETYQWYYEGDAIPGETGLVHQAMLSGEYLISGVRPGCGEFQSCVPIDVPTDLSLNYRGPICIDGCESSATSASFFLTVSNVLAGTRTAPAGMPIRVYDGDPFAGPANVIDTLTLPRTLQGGQSETFPVSIDLSSTTLPRDICIAINVRELAVAPLNPLTDFQSVTNGVFECGYANNVSCVRIECTPADLFAR